MRGPAEEEKRQMREQLVQLCASGMGVQDVLTRPALLAALREFERDLQRQQVTLRDARVPERVLSDLRQEYGFPARSAALRAVELLRGLEAHERRASRERLEREAGLPRGRQQILAWLRLHDMDIAQPVSEVVKYRICQATGLKFRSVETMIAAIRRELGLPTPPRTWVRRVRGRRR